jgi:hypothetical protein
VSYGVFHAFDSVSIKYAIGSNFYGFFYQPPWFFCYDKGSPASIFYSIYAETQCFRDSRLPPAGAQRRSPTGSYPSSDEGWAFIDLSNAMDHAADP